MSPPTARISQSDQFQALRAEVGKLESSSARVDWAQVRALARQVLEQLGQDLLAAAYWAHAEHMCAGLTALPASLDVLSDLLEFYWFELSPPMARIKGRAGAISWLVERTTCALQSLSKPPDDLELAPLLAAVQRLQHVAQKRLEGRAPNFGALRAAAARLQESLPVPEPQPAPDGVVPPRGPPAAPAASAPCAPHGPALSGASSLLAMGRMLAAHALSLRQKDPLDPGALRLLRVGLWLHIQEAPAHTSSGQTRIPGLPQSIRASAAAHKAAGRWQALLDETERHCLGHRMQLDLQRHAAQALRQLGAPYAQCLAVVEAEVRSFVDRVPKLLDLLAVDNTPLADVETQAWIKGLRHGPIVAAAGPPAAMRAASGHPPPQSLGAAAAKAPDSRVAFDGAGRFVARLDQAEAAYKRGHMRVAGALYRGLAQQLRRRRLMSWDTALSLRLLVGYWRCVQGAPTQAQLSQKLLRQIAWLDADTATKLV